MENAEGREIFIVYFRDFPISVYSVADFKAARSEAGQPGAGVSRIEP